MLDGLKTLKQSAFHGVACYKQVMPHSKKLWPTLINNQTAQDDTGKR
jgi:hypothetical protein